MFVFSPVAGLLIAVVIIGWLIGAGAKSVGRKLDAVSYDDVPDLKEIKRQLGPMTWQEHLVGVLLIAAFVAFVVWLAMVT